MFVLSFLLTIKILHYFNQRLKLPKKNQWSPINKNDVVLITGGSRGFGLEIIKAFIEFDVFKIINLDIIPTQIDNSKIEFYKCDVGNRKRLVNTLIKIIEKLKQENKIINILINNAGVRHNKPFLELKPEEIIKIFNVNSFSHLWTSRHVLKDYIESNNTNDKKHKLFIVYVSSILATLAPKNLSVYSASKSIICQIHEALTQELSHFSSIRLLLLLPGQLNSGMFSDVKPSNSFFSPLVDYKFLAKNVVERINKGESGVLCVPFYTNFLGIVKILPMFLQICCRKLSKVDKKIVFQSDTTHL